MTDQSVSRRKQIMKKAKKLFAEKGYHGVRMEELAESCNIAKGTLYLYFDSKSELFTRVFINVLDKIINDIREIMLQDNGLEETLYSIFNYFEDSIRRDRYFKRFGEMHRGCQGNLPAEIVLEIKKTIFSRIESLSREAEIFFQKHISDTELNLKDLYDILVGISVSISRSRSKTIKDTALHVILEGIKKEVQG